MAGTRKARVPMAEQIRIINACRKSGMTDADWCRENDICLSTFYNWISRCRKAAAGQIPAPNYGHHEEPVPKQAVVPIDIVPDCIQEQNVAISIKIYISYMRMKTAIQEKGKQKKKILKDGMTLHRFCWMQLNIASVIRKSINDWLGKTV